jgi:hypothetical protein
MPTLPVAMIAARTNLRNETVEFICRFPFL